jgi:hypothetical protein
MEKDPTRATNGRGGSGIYLPKAASPKIALRKIQR